MNDTNADHAADRILQERPGEAEGDAVERQPKPEALQPFGGGPLPDYVTELAPGDYLLEMPGPQAQAEAV